MVEYTHASTRRNTRTVQFRIGDVTFLGMHPYPTPQPPSGYTYFQVHSRYTPHLHPHLQPKNGQRSSTTLTGARPHCHPAHRVVPFPLLVRRSTISNARPSLLQLHRETSSPISRTSPPPRAQSSTITRLSQQHHCSSLTFTHHQFSLISTAQPLHPVAQGSTISADARPSPPPRGLGSIIARLLPLHLNSFLTSTAQTINANSSTHASTTTQRAHKSPFNT